MANSPAAGWWEGIVAVRTGKRMADAKEEGAKLNQVLHTQLRQLTWPKIPYYA